jgi:hypothetical protein
MRPAERFRIYVFDRAGRLRSFRGGDADGINLQVWGLPTRQGRNALAQLSSAGLATRSPGQKSDRFSVHISGNWEIQQSIHLVTNRDATLVIIALEDLKQID